MKFLTKNRSRNPFLFLLTEIIFHFTIFSYTFLLVSSAASLNNNNISDKSPAPLNIKHEIATTTTTISPSSTSSSYKPTSSVTGLPINSTTTTTKTTTSPTATPKPVFHLPPPRSAPSIANATRNSLLRCPPPLIHNIKNLSTATCKGECCLPCPASTIFYEPGKLESIHTTVSVIRVISAIACAILAGAYLILPNQRKHPHMIVLLFALLMVPWEGLSAIWLFKRESLLCKDIFEVTDVANSWLCGFQGIALVYLVLVILCLGFILISNLHFIVVFNSYRIQANMTRLIFVALALPLSTVIPIIVQKQIKNPGVGSICFVGPEIADAYLFIPMATIVGLATIMHLATIFFMSRIKQQSSREKLGFDLSPTRAQRSLRTARDISLLLKQQWRPGVLAICFLITDLIYWLFYFIEAKHLQMIDFNSQGFQNWFGCLVNQVKVSITIGDISLETPTQAQMQFIGDNAQKVCAPFAKPWVPNLVWLGSADLIPAVFGIIILAIFGTRMELWRDLKIKLFGVCNHHYKNNDGSSGGSIASNRRGFISCIFCKKKKPDIHKNLPPPPRPKPDIPPRYTETPFIFFEPNSPTDRSEGLDRAQVTDVVSAERYSQLMSSYHTPGQTFEYRPDTPEAWKVATLPTHIQQPEPVHAKGDQDTLSIHRGSGSNGSSKSQGSRSPVMGIESNSEARGITSLTLPPRHHKRFYNTEDFDALPITLCRTPSASRLAREIIHRGSSSTTKHPPVLESATKVRANSDEISSDGDAQSTIVSEASRVQLNYRANMDIRTFAMQYQELSSGALPPSPLSTSPSMPSSPTTTTESTPSRSPSKSRGRDSLTASTKLKNTPSKSSPLRSNSPVLPISQYFSTLSHNRSASKTLNRTDSSGSNFSSHLTRDDTIRVSNTSTSQNPLKSYSPFEYNPNLERNGSLHRSNSNLSLNEYQVSRFSSSKPPPSTPPPPPPGGETLDSELFRASSLNRNTPSPERPHKSNARISAMK